MRVATQTAAKYGCDNHRSQQLCTMASNSLDTVTSATVRISSDFCGGNIELVDVFDNEDATSCQAQLRIRPDVYSELERKQHSQYFCFGATVHHLDDDGSPTKTVEFVIQSAAEASFPAAWKGTTVFYSYVCNCGYGCAFRWVHFTRTLTCLSYFSFAGIA
jgi:Cytosolic carboxypeptidase N-terminal domain